MVLQRERVSESEVDGHACAEYGVGWIPLIMQGSVSRRVVWEDWTCKIALNARFRECFGKSEARHGHKIQTGCSATERGLSRRIHPYEND